MPEPGIFSIDDDIRALAERAKESLALLDQAVGKAISFMDTAGRVATKVEQMLAAVQGEAKK